MKIPLITKAAKIVFALGGVAAWTAITAGAMYWVAKKVTEPKKPHDPKPPKGKKGK